VLAGRSAAYLFGIPTAEPWDDRVEVAVPANTRIRTTGLVVHQTPLAPGDVLPLSGLRVTTPLRTCWDLAQWLEPVDAVPLLDQLVRSRPVTTVEIGRYAREREGERGWRRALRAAELIDAGAESLQESRLRVRLVLAGVARPVTQYVIEQR